MGKIVKSVGKFAVGKGISMALGGGIPGMIGSSAFGMATSGGGGKGGASPSVAYGTGDNTYTMGGKPVDTSKYWIKGDKGVYNLLLIIGDTTNKAYQTKTRGAMGLENNQLDSQKQAQYILSQMNGDKTAITAFNKSFLTPAGTTRGAMGLSVPTAASYNFGLTPKQAAPAFGIMTGGNPQIQQISQYAAQQKNPFFMQYAPQQIAAALTAPSYTPAKAAYAPAQGTYQAPKGK